MKLSQYEQTIFTNVSTVNWGEPAKKGQYKCQATTCEVFGKESMPLLPNCTCLWAYSRLKNFCLASGKPLPNGKWFFAFSLWISPCNFTLKECRNLIHPRSISTEVKGTDHQICFFSCWVKIRHSSYRTGPWCCAAFVRAAGYQHVLTSSSMDSSMASCLWDINSTRKLRVSAFLDKNLV